MKQFDMDCYEVWDTDGYTHNHVAFVSTESLAKELVNGNGYMGYSRYQKSITIYESIQEYKEAKEQALRAQALAKLTAAERAALGL